MVTASSTSVFIWEAVTGRLRSRLSDAVRILSGVAISAGAHTVAAGSLAGEVVVWDGVTGTVRARAPSPSGVLDVALLDEDRLVALSASEVMVLNASSGHTLQKLRSGGEVRLVLCCRLATASTRADASTVARASATSSPLPPPLLQPLPQPVPPPRHSLSSWRCRIRRLFLSRRLVACAVASIAASSTISAPLSLPPLVPLPRPPWPPLPMLSPLPLPPLVASVAAASAAAFTSAPAPAFATASAVAAAFASAAVSGPSGTFAHLPPPAPLLPALAPSSPFLSPHGCRVRGSRGWGMGRMGVADRVVGVQGFRGVLGAGIGRGAGECGWCTGLRVGVRLGMPEGRSRCGEGKRGLPQAHRRLSLERRRGHMRHTAVGPRPRGGRLESRRRRPVADDLGRGPLGRVQRPLAWQPLQHRGGVRAHVGRPRGVTPSSPGAFRSQRARREVLAWCHLSWSRGMGVVAVWLAARPPASVFTMIPIRLVPGCCTRGARADADMHRGLAGDFPAINTCMSSAGRVTCNGSSLPAGTRRATGLKPYLSTCLPQKPRNPTDVDFDAHAKLARSKWEHRMFHFARLSHLDAWTRLRW